MWNIIFDIVLTLIIFTLAGLTFYLDTKKKILEEVNGKIDGAEDTEEVGAIKMELVVDSIYNNIVPKILRPILNKAVIEKMVQAAFDKIEDYAQKQVEKSKSK